MQALPGVIRYLDYTDIPPEGVNNFTPTDQGQPEEVFCSSDVLYAGQAVGLILAGQHYTDHVY